MAEMVREWDAELVEFSDDEIESAFRACKRNCEFPPSLAEFIRCAQEERERQQRVEKAKLDKDKRDEWRSKPKGEMPEEFKSLIAELAEKVKKNQNVGGKF